MADYEIIRKLFGDPSVSSAEAEVVWSRVEDVLSEQDLFFKTERIAECDDLIRRIQTVAEQFAALPEAKAAVSEYLRQTLLHLEHVKTEPKVDHLTWKDQTLSDASLEVPGMITHDAMKYYK